MGRSIQQWATTTTGIGALDRATFAFSRHFVHVSRICVQFSCLDCGIGAHIVEDTKGQ